MGWGRRGGCVVQICTEHEGGYIEY
jgi:hypothetical protein